jgi:2TM family of unknown function (DUF5676)
MDHIASSTPVRAKSGVRRARSELRTIPVVSFELSLSAFFAISFTLCVLGYLFLPDLPVAHGILMILLPGFILLSWPRFFLGLAESLAWGWYIALVFGLLYNYFVARKALHDT